jgi:hypothetical protein
VQFFGKVKGVNRKSLDQFLYFGERSRCLARSRFTNDYRLRETLVHVVCLHVLLSKQAITTKWLRAFSHRLDQLPNDLLDIFSVQRGLLRQPAPFQDISF